MWKASNGHVEFVNFEHECCVENAVLLSPVFYSLTFPAIFMMPYFAKELSFALVLTLLGTKLL